MSSAARPLDLDSQYKKILNTQKELIKNNKYVRELEARYHKPNIKYLKPPAAKKSVDLNQAHSWPIESSMFTKILKSKLESILTPYQAKQDAKPNTGNLSRPKSRCKYSAISNKQDSNNNMIQLNLGSYSGTRRQKSMQLYSHRKGIKSQSRTYSNDIPAKRQGKADISINDSIEINYEDELRDIHLITIPRYY